ncbi:NAD(P)/FAD-dependent oxidoreductase [Amnibacterium kyonggiense]
MSTDVLVVGAGLSGLAVARRCADAGLAVRVLDRGRRPGGRLGARALDEHEVDLGAPYCTASDDRFRAVVDDWTARGLLRPWTDAFRLAGPDGLGEAKPGPMRYAAPGGMRSLADDLATGLVVERRTVERVGPGPVVDGERVRAVVLAMPGPQAARLLDEEPALARTAQQPYAPVIAVAARFAARTWPEFDGAFVSDLPISWLADDGRSRGDGSPVLVAHTTPEVAGDHLEAPDGVVGEVLDAMRRVLSVPLEPVETLAQRWTFARPTEQRDRTFLLDPSGVGLCGDGWSEKSRVEAAWLSGDDLGAALVGHLR